MGTTRKKTCGHNMKQTQRATVERGLHGNGRWEGRRGILVRMRLSVKYKMLSVAARGEGKGPLLREDQTLQTKQIMALVWILSVKGTSRRRLLIEKSLRGPSNPIWSDNST